MRAYSLARAFSRLFWCTIWLAGAGAIVAFWQADFLDTASLGDSLQLEYGRLLGLLGTYFVLWQLVLMSRLPVLVSAFDLTVIARIHRYNGYLGLGLIAVHVVLITIGHAISSHAGVIAQFIDFQLHWANVFVATTGLVLLFAIVGLSVAIVRRRLRYETWYAVHTTTYLAIALASSHQFSVGDDIMHNSVFHAYWMALYIFAFGAIVVFRMAIPLYRLWRYRFTVSKVASEAIGTVSIYITGRNIKRFRYKAGQFAIWRFLTPDLWLQAHPFSFSSSPGNNELRLTVKAVGDFTHTLQDIKSGAPVLIDGPHGGFILEPKPIRPRLFIAGGIGITPLIAMLESLPANTPPPIVIYGAQTRANIALDTELKQQLARTDGRLHYVLSKEDVKGFHSGVIDQPLITKLVPDVTDREIYLCGPPEMMVAVRKALTQSGVQHGNIHTERFAFLG